MEEIIELLSGRGLTEPLRGLVAAKNFLQPFNELRSAVKQPKRLIARRKLDVNFDDRSAFHDICDGRHGLNDQRFREAAAQTGSSSYAISL
jgi:hypothetical protein